MHDQFTPFIPAGYCQCGCGRMTTIAAQSRSKHGIVAGQYNLYCRGHRPKKRSWEIDLWYEIDPSGCWVWSRPLQKNGYAVIRLSDGRKYYAHRFSYVQAHGPIPIGWEIHHRCKNPACIRPDHLEALPRAVHARKHARLSDANVMAIRELAGTMTCREIGDRFGISEGHASRIILGRGKTQPPPKRVYVNDVVSSEQVRLILEMGGTHSQRKIARMLGVTRSQVRAILARHHMAKR